MYFPSNLQIYTPVLLYITYSFFFQVVDLVIIIHILNFSDYSANFV